MNDSTQFIITVDSTYTLQRDSIKFTKTDHIAGSISTGLWFIGLVVSIMIFIKQNK